jgi:hypothetical protein
VFREYQQRTSGGAERLTQYIALNHNYSNQFLVDEVRQRILSLVHDPSSQISCSFGALGRVGEHYDAANLCNLNRIHINCDARSLSLITNVEEVHLSMWNNQYLDDFRCLAQVKKKLFITICDVDDEDGGTDVSPFYDLSCLSATLESLSLSNVDQIANYHLFTNLREVELDTCDSIEEVSCFRNAESVTLSWCRYVTNVNSLSKVKELILIGCDGVTDVSALGRVGVMTVANCKNLHDLSALSTVHTLTVSYFPGNLLSSLKQNTVLNLSYFSSELTSIQFLVGNKVLRVLNISNNENLHDISMLGKKALRVLNISNNENLRDISMLGKKALRVLNISNNENIRDISMLSTVEVLDITNCPLVTSLPGLTALKELNMSGVEGIESGFGNIFQQLKKLRIGKVIHRHQIIQALEKAPFLSSLTLFNSNLPIDSLSQVKDLVFWYCLDLTEFRATFIHLRSLKISGCRNLESFPAFLPFLQLLYIGGSDKLSLLKIFGDPNSPPINQVEISHCSLLTQIQITRKITSLEILKCRNLKEICGKELIRSLKDFHSD